MRKAGPSRNAAFWPTAFEEERVCFGGGSFFFNIIIIIGGGGSGGGGRRGGEMKKKEKIASLVSLPRPPTLLFFSLSPPVACSLNPFQTDLDDDHAQQRRQGNHGGCFRHTDARTEFAASGSMPFGHRRIAAADDHALAQNRSIESRAG